MRWGPSVEELKGPHSAGRTRYGVGSRIHACRRNRVFGTEACGNMFAHYCCEIRFIEWGLTPTNPKSLAVPHCRQGTAPAIGCSFEGNGRGRGERTQQRWCPGQRALLSPSPPDGGFNVFLRQSQSLYLFPNPIQLHSFGFDAHECYGPRDRIDLRVS